MQPCAQTDEILGKSEGAPAQPSIVEEILQELLEVGSWSLSCFVSTAPNTEMNA